MPIVQQASGSWTGTAFTPTLPAASSASNTVVIAVAGNVTATTPTNWTLRTSQVAQMGHYWFDRVAVSLTSVAMTSGSGGGGTWVIAEISGGAYVTATGANNTATATTYTSPAITPTAGTRIILATFSSLSTGGARTVSTWLNSFVEIADLAATGTDNPMQGVGILDSVAADGVASYSTGVTFSATSIGRSALIAAYATSAAVTPPALPIIVLAPRR